MRLILLCPLVLSSGCLLAGTPDATEGIPKPLTAETKSATLATGSPSDPDRLANLPRLLWDDTKHVIGAPARWDQSDWLTAGICAAAVVGAGLLLDRPVDKYVMNHPDGSRDRFARSVEELGGTPSILIAGGTYLAGIAFKEPEVRATGVDAMATMGIAQLLLVLPLKVATGRSRPEENQGTHDFHPFRGGQSFPSGHTTQAFALAAVISEHADRTWVSVLSYGLASGVGLARVEQRKHFMSDVVAGGLIGTFIGKSVVAYNQSQRADARSKVTMSFAPMLQPGGYGLSVAMRF